MTKLKKLMVGLALLGAVLWLQLVFASSGPASNFISYTYLASGTSDSTVVISWRPASNLCVYAVSQDVAVSWNNNGSDAGTVPAGKSMTWDDISLYQFTLDRTNATAVYAWTW